jgi:hypothetical protein
MSKLLNLKGSSDKHGSDQSDNDDDFKRVTTLKKTAEVIIILVDRQTRDRYS